jgi:hypothetical protein
MEKTKTKQEPITFSLDVIKQLEIRRETERHYLFKTVTKQDNGWKLLYDTKNKRKDSFAAFTIGRKTFTLNLADVLKVDERLLIVAEHPTMDTPDGCIAIHKDNGNTVRGWCGNLRDQMKYLQDYRREDDND